jgi:endonuclease G
MVNPARAVQAGINILLLTVWYAVSLAAETACPQHFADGTAPDFINQNLAIKAREVCYSGYAVMHSGVTRTPIYAAEYLTKERLLQAKGIKRQNRFHPDEHIPKDERAELKHYTGSGFDRGHLQKPVNNIL